MPIKTPKFWYPEKTHIRSITPVLFAPLSALYQLGHGVFQAGKNTQSVPVPVICIGNITAGGSGKTPICIAIAKLLKQKNPELKLVFLTRGYRGRQTEPRCIKGHEPSFEVGDEPLMLAQHAKTIVSPMRYKGAQVACEQGAECIIMDDGLINKDLKKDITFMVIDGSVGIGNGKTIPAGPLREPFENGLEHANAVILIGEDLYNIKQKLPANYPCFDASIKADTTGLDKVSKYVAFAGIGIPQKFKNTLKDNDVQISEFLEYPDHHPYTENEIEVIVKRAEKAGLKIITTEKDHVRLPKNFKKKIQYLPIEIEWKSPNKVFEYISEALN